ncbi:formyltransferase family protein [Akkermansiaceae bacterium]|nr:formyltransferase family protein [Akkermansiaceae bacterium]
MTYNKKSIVFIGAVDLSFRLLDHLIKKGFNISGIITKKSSNENSDFRSLSPLAKENQIPIIFKEVDNEEKIIVFLKNLTPDVIYCCGWSHLLSKKILKIPHHGVVGFHPAKLPYNRGRHPIVWALFLGLERTASTFFLMDEGADTGDIISQEMINISEDNALSLYEKIVDVALIQVENLCSELELTNGFSTRIKQRKTEGNSWRKRNKDDGEIDFRMTSDAICNLIKALGRPYVGAHIQFRGESIKIWKAKKETTSLQNYEPGKILEVVGSEILVKTYDGAIRLLEHELITFPNQGDYL